MIPVWLPYIFSFHLSSHSCPISFNRSSFFFFFIHHPFTVFFSFNLFSALHSFCLALSSVFSLILFPNHNFAFQTDSFYSLWSFHFHSMINLSSPFSSYFIIPLSIPPHEHVVSFLSWYLLFCLHFPTNIHLIPLILMIYLSSYMRHLLLLHLLFPST